MISKQMLPVMPSSNESLPDAARFFDDTPILLKTAHFTLFHLGAWLGLLVIGGVAPAGACSIPVFRYALDHWSAEPYHLEVPPADLSVWEAARPTPDPWLLLSAAEPAGEGEPAAGAVLLQPFAEDWIPLAEALTPDALPAWLDSPVRRTLGERITGGDSAVFLILHAAGEDPAAAVARTEARLQYLKGVVDLPELDPTDPADTLGPGPPLAIRFSTLTLSRADETERPLVAMLTRFLGEEDTGETVVIPLFGRGRALGMLPIDDELENRLDEVVLYLCGACSCQVKKDNPGWDLLMAFDWEAKLREAAAATPALASMAPASAAPTPEMVTTAPSTPTPVAAAERNWFPLIFGGGILLLCGLAIARFFR